jgi:hypothetical protein
MHPRPQPAPPEPAVEVAARAVAEADRVEAAAVVELLRRPNQLLAFPMEPSTWDVRLVILTACGASLTSRTWLTVRPTGRTPVAVVAAAVVVVAAAVVAQQQLEQLLQAAHKLPVAAVVAAELQQVGHKPVGHKPVGVAELLQQPQRAHPQVELRQPQPHLMPTPVAAEVEAVAVVVVVAQPPNPGYLSCRGLQPSTTTIPRTSPSTIRRDIACLPAVPVCTPLRIRWSFSSNPNSSASIRSSKAAHTSGARSSWMAARTLPRTSFRAQPGSVTLWAAGKGDTLVVDVTNFNEGSWLDYFGHPHTDQMHVTERWTRPNKNTLHYEATIDDPGAYSAPWTTAWDINWSGQSIDEYICQENNQYLNHLKDDFGRYVIDHGEELQKF